MIQIKSKQNIAVMQVGGQKLAQVLEEVLAHSTIGVSLKELDILAEKFLREAGGIPSFKGYQNFPGSICVSVNEGLVHGVPSKYLLQDGDLLTIDIGLKYEGFHTDMARTIVVGETDARKERFLKAGQQSLQEAIEEAVIGNRVGDISFAMGSVIEKFGYSVSKTFTGHGVGKSLHEDPSIPCSGQKGKGPLLKENMVVAIEVIYAEGKADAVVDSSDNWTVETQDKSWGGLFENTVAITKDGPLVLTLA